jgi:hypothetical protein
MQLHGLMWVSFDVTRRVKRQCGKYWASRADEKSDYMRSKLDLAFLMENQNVDMANERKDQRQSRCGVVQTVQRAPSKPKRRHKSVTPWSATSEGWYRRMEGVALDPGDGCVMKGVRCAPRPSDVGSSSTPAPRTVFLGHDE